MQKKLFSLFVFLTVAVMGISMAAAAESSQWSQVDLSQVDYTKLDRNEWESLIQWLRTEGTFEDALCVRGSSVTEVWAEPLDGAMSELFLTDPQGALTRLAQEEESAWQMYATGIVVFPPDYQAMISALTSLKPSGPDTQTEQRILDAMFATMEANYPQHILNPKTGDPAGVAAALLAASGAGMVILPKLRRKRDEDA